MLSLRSASSAGPSPDAATRAAECVAPGPKSTAQPPNVYVQETMGDLPQDVVSKILHDNAARIYHLD